VARKSSSATKAKPTTVASRNLAFQDGSSNKFWSIELRGCSLTVRFGRIGTEGQQLTKDFASDEQARKAYDKLVAEKLKKGYTDASAKAGGSQAPRVTESKSAAKSAAKAMDAKKAVSDGGDERAPWAHTHLGHFKWDGMDWTTMIEMPALRAFAYNAGDRGARRRKGKVPLVLQADDETGLPSKAAISAVLRILANQSKLVGAITKALWDDFNGRGPDSGMWWHGHLDEVAEGAERLLTKRDDLLAVMSVSEISVRNDITFNDKPVVEVDFEAAFEPEHGVGVLTNGQTIFGIGYSIDVDAFESKPSSRRQVQKVNTYQPVTIALDSDRVRGKRLAAVLKSLGCTKWRCPGVRSNPPDPPAWHWPKYKNTRDVGGPAFVSVEKNKTYGYSPKFDVRRRGHEMLLVGVTKSQRAACIRELTDALGEGAVLLNDN
jgi:predicted DNA-binding WGR domain protein